MPILSIFGKKGPSPEEIARDLTKRIEGWLKKPDELNQSQREYNLSMYRAQYLNDLNGSRYFLEQLNQKIKEALSAKPVNKELISKVAEVFNNFDRAASDQKNLQEDLNRAANMKSKPKTETANPMEPLYRKYEAVFKEKCVAEIGEKHPIKPKF